MKRYSDLYPRIVCFSNLYTAAQRAFRGKLGKTETARFHFNLEKELFRLEAELKAEKYKVGPYRNFTVYEPKERLITTAVFRDRVVHHAICRILGPIWDATLIHDTYACRINKGAHRAIAKAQHYSRRFRYYFKCDIRKYFDTIDHTILGQILRKKIKDKALLRLLDQIIVTPQLSGQTSGKGIPIGNLTSQYFANLYLGELDHYLKSQKAIKGYLRYMDDMLVFSDEKPQLDEWTEIITDFLNQRLQLQLKEKASVLAPVNDGIPWLGVRVFPGVIRLQRERWQRFRKKYKQREKAYIEGRLPEDRFVNSVNGLLEQTRWADTLHLRRGFFNDAKAPVSAKRLDFV